MDEDREPKEGVLMEEEEDVVEVGRFWIRVQ